MSQGAKLLVCKKLVPTCPMSEGRLLLGQVVPWIAVCRQHKCFEKNRG